MARKALKRRLSALVVITTLLASLPVSVIPSDVCGIANTDITPAAVMPCPNPPPSQTLPGYKCAPWFWASCRDVPCRCTTYTYCYGRGSFRICVSVTICEEFVSTRVQFPRCYPSPGSVCTYNPRECGMFYKYLGNCGGIRFWSFRGWILSCT